MIVFYVAVNGSDENTGTKEAPFASLEAARDRVRQLKREGSRLDGGVEIRLRGGVYRLRDSFRLSEEDSGYPDAPVVYTIEENEQARITCGVAVPVSQWTAVADQTVLKRLPEAVWPYIRQLRLADIGVYEYEPIVQRGFGYPVSLQPPELFMDGKAMELPRYPKTGFLEISQVLDPGGNPREWNEEAVRYDEEKRKGAIFQCEDKRMALWSNTEDVWVYGYFYWDWADCSMRISKLESSDTSTTIITEQASYYSIRNGQRFYFHNVLEELSGPGQWYVDSKAGVVYIYPPCPLQEADAELSLFTKPILVSDGASHIRFRRLQVELTRSDAILVQGGTDVAVEGCSIGRTGGYAVTIGDPLDGGNNAGSGHSVRSCTLFDCGGGGIYLAGGKRNALIAGCNVAVNNDIFNYSRLKRTYSPAIELHGVGNKAIRNYIHDAPHVGIYIYGNDHLIEGNEITRILQETGDAGAIYLGRDWTEQGNIIRYNRISGIGNDVTKLQIGIYLDDMASGTLVYGNIVCGTQRAILVGGGRSNRIENNLIACCKEALIIDDRAMPGEWAAKHALFGEVMHKRLLAVPYKQSVWRQRYPELTDIWEDEPASPKYNKVFRNLSYRNQAITIRGIRYEDSLALTETAFVKGEMAENASADQDIDFNTPGDPASGIVPGGNIHLLIPGFQPIPVVEIGLFADELRINRK